MLRVVAGEAKGRLLKSPKGLKSRPVTNKIKEAIFDILGLKIRDAFVLDLFAGSGSLGVEALSRGAKMAIFVDESQQAADAIRENLNTLGWESKAKVFCARFSSTLKRLVVRGERFDIVFSDPPYRQQITLQVLEKLSASGIVAPDGLVITRFRKDERLPDVITGFKAVVKKTYGDSKVVFWTPIPAKEGN